MSSIHALTMPKWGLSMTEGEVAGWLVAEGTKVGKGTELAEIKTDKILGVLEAPVPGVLRRTLAGASDMVPVGGLLGILADSPITDSEIDTYIADFRAHFVPETEAQSAASGPETIVVGKHSLRYLRMGNGEEQSLLVHGFGGDLKTWLFNQQELAADRTVYALDLPGHGGSSKSVGSGNLAELGNVLGAFLDGVGVASAHVAGHSMGGAIALELACAHPERFRSLCLISSAGLGPEVDGEFIQGLITATRRKEIERQIKKLFAKPMLISRQLVEEVLKYKRLDGVEAALRKIADQFFPGGRQAVVLRDQLGSLEVPVLVIWGADDRILPATHAQGLSNTVRTEILAGSGHMVHMEEAAEVNRSIRSFWDSV